MGTAERKEREKLQRRQAIIDAAENVFFSKGYNNSSMDDVAGEAELSKGTLYLYFHSKDDLYAAIVTRGAEIMNKLFTEAASAKVSGLEKVRNIGFAFIKFYTEYPNYHDAMMFDQGKQANLECECDNDFAAIELKKRSNMILVNCIIEGMEDGSIKKDIDPVGTALVLWGSALGVMQLLKNKAVVLKEAFEMDEQKVIDEFMNFAFKSLAS